MSPTLVATLLLALRPDSRIKMMYSDTKVTFNQLMMAQMIDGINILIWQNTKNGHKGRKRPKSLYEKLIGKEQKQDYEQFESPEDFEKWRKTRFQDVK